MLAPRQRSPLLRTALAAAVAGLALWACSGEVIPPGGDPGSLPPGAVTGPDGGQGDGGPGGTDGGNGDGGSSGTDGGKPDGGPADAGGPGGDAGAGGDDRFPGGATLYRDVSGAPLDPSSAQIIAHLADAGWGTGAMQIDFSFAVLHADSSVQPRAFTPAAGYYSPDCDQVPVPLPPGGAAEGSSNYACDTTRNDCHFLVYQGRRLYELYQASVS